MGMGRTQCFISLFLTSGCQWGRPVRSIQPFTFSDPEETAQQPSLYSVPLWPCPDRCCCLQILRLEPCMQHAGGTHIRQVCLLSSSLRFVFPLAPRFWNKFPHQGYLVTS